MMARFRKKPIVIEAEQFLPSKGQWPEGVRNTPNGICGCALVGGEGVLPHVHTMHMGQGVIVEEGDWIVPDGKPGTFYPIKPDVFALTYDPEPEP